MMTPFYFPVVYFDIVGFCNGKCPYCITGKEKKISGEAISPELFHDSLKKLMDHKVIDDKSVIHLYNWGEPFLHPAFSKIIEVINDLNLKYALSTNASRLPEMNSGLIKNLRGVIFSMPGFSQHSYDKIHGFNFERIQKNISQFVEDSRALNYTGSFTLYYHIYQFNLDEIPECKKFANQYGIHFRPFYALLNHWDDLNKLIREELSNQELKKISEELFSFDIREKMKMAPKDYKCPQYQYLIINQKADVLPCCQLPTYHPDYSCGNLLKDDLDTILVSREKKEVCRECLKSGLAFYINNSMIEPSFIKHLK